MPIKTSAPRSVLIVCLGNICRSPTAEEILRQKTAVAGMSMNIDSAGTGDWNVGNNPDPRSQKYAKRHGYNISKLVARQVTADDFTKFDLILAMDQQNLKDLQAIKDQLRQDSDSDLKLAKLALFSEEDPTYCGEDVPDPYYGEREGFESVIEQIESSVDAWIESWKTD